MSKSMRDVKTHGAMYSMFYQSWITLEADKQRAAFTSAFSNLQVSISNFWFGLSAALPTLIVGYPGAIRTYMEYKGMKTIPRKQERMVLWFNFWAHVNSLLAAAFDNGDTQPWASKTYHKVSASGNCTQKPDEPAKICPGTPLDPQSENRHISKPVSVPLFSAMQLPGDLDWANETEVKAFFGDDPGPIDPEVATFKCTGGSIFGRVSKMTSVDTSMVKYFNWISMNPHAEKRIVFDNRRNDILEGKWNNVSDFMNEASFGQQKCEHDRRPEYVASYIAHEISKMKPPSVTNVFQQYGQRVTDEFWRDSMMMPNNDWDDKSNHFIKYFPAAIRMNYMSMSASHGQSYHTPIAHGAMPLFTHANNILMSVP